MAQNNFLKRTTSLLALACAAYTVSLSAYAPTNFFRPYEVDYRLHDWKTNKTNLRLGVAAEYGTTSKCRDWDENKKNVLQRYNEKESSIAMLLGAPTGSATDRFARSLGLSAATATADGCRGAFTLTGEYEQAGCTFFGKYKLPINLEGTFTLGVYVPLQSMEFKNVKWCDNTKDVLIADKEFKDEVSSKLACKAKALGCLDINEKGWKETGIGDVAVILQWYKNFKQSKEYLKNVRVNTQLGLTIPTGKKQDIDQALSLPLGNDGAYAIPFSLGLDLDFVQNMRAGIDLSILGHFDKTRTYRMKTAAEQTDFLLLNKGIATKSQGVTWKFTLYAQAKKIFHGLSGMVSYHFVKNDETRLHPKSYNFDHSIVNSAQSLKEWSTHSFVFQVGYDPCGKKAPFKPHLSLFYKLPVAGKRSILANTFGRQVAVAF